MTPPDRGTGLTLKDIIPGLRSGKLKIVPYRVDENGKVRIETVVPVGTENPKPEVLRRRKLEYPPPVNES